MRFETSRPASMHIYKKTNESSDWQPYQYYTYDCEKDYGLKANVRISQSNYHVQHNFQNYYYYRCHYISSGGKILRSSTLSSSYDCYAESVEEAQAKWRESTCWDHLLRDYIQCKPDYVCVMQESKVHTHAAKASHVQLL